MDFEVWTEDIPNDYHVGLHIVNSQSVGAIVAAADAIAVATVAAVASATLT